MAYYLEMLIKMLIIFCLLHVVLGDRDETYLEGVVFEADGVVYYVGLLILIVELVWFNYY